MFLRSKVKVSERSNFGGERLLGAANGDERKRGIHGIKRQSREGEDCAARGKEDCRRCGKILEVEEQQERKRRPTRNADMWGTQIHLSDLRLGHPS